MTREDAIKVIKSIIDVEQEYGGKDNIDALNMAIQELSQEPTDAVSRKDIQDYIAKYLSQYLYEDVRQAVEVIDTYIGDLPPVTPSRRKGRWIETDPDDPCWYKCSNCGRLEDMPDNYCPKCGAENVEPQESEERND